MIVKILRTFVSSSSGKKCRDVTHSPRPKDGQEEVPISGTKKVFGLQSARLFMDAGCRQCRGKYPGRSVPNDPRSQLTTAAHCVIKDNRIGHEILTLIFSFNYV